MNDLYAELLPLQTDELLATRKSQIQENLKAGLIVQLFIVGLGLVISLTDGGGWYLWVLFLFASVLAVINYRRHVSLGKFQDEIDRRKYGKDET